MDTIYKRNFEMDSIYKQNFEMNTIMKPLASNSEA